MNNGSEFLVFLPGIKRKKDINYLMNIFSKFAINLFLNSYIDKY